ncbi:hypothetical protein CDO73_04275 [Saccharibacillus sp. O23]|uniref:MerR family transcriptional regulator n=1 Tax=Saccharibacillus sp. O23 TaxID=2009338 RepID=UPI000B4E6C91|nr:MerR family transcriptional regulator [Saccharibacillus sp. O23]OWR31706.1 hypothetical protein CDO73_04275 [Saccharibacillus sp. O23]
MRKYWKTGELSALTGLTLRTLRYYDQIGLFSPSARTGSGHRLYDTEDLSRLQRILLLKSIGLSLEEIRDMQSGGNDEAARVLELQIGRLRSELEARQRLLSELEEALRAARTRRKMNAQELTLLLGAMKSDREKYFTRRQIETLHADYANGDSDAERAESERFARIVLELRIEFEKGTPPQSEKAGRLAREWKDIVSAYARGSAEMMANAERFHAANPDSELSFGLDERLYRYMMEALSGL